jgi:2-dehydro-3-deoxygalactonokinase
MPDPLWRAALAGSDGLTVWPMGADGAGAAEHHPPDALAALPGPVIAAGLDGAARPVPCTPLGGTGPHPGAREVAAIPMLGQQNPPALSRGGETAIAGYLKGDPDFDGVILVLGTETLWAQVSAREVVSFAAFLTPGLARALAAPAPQPGPAFDAALSETLSRPDRLAQHLAGARAARSGQEAAHLIGAEIAAAKPWWLGQQVAILGDAPEAYAAALAAQGVPARSAPFTENFLKGCTLAWTALTPPASSGS